MGRAKYIRAVLQQEKEERLTDTLAGGLLPSLSALIWVNEEEENNFDVVIDEEVEMVYLTLSWWVLHVGWKDVGERVRRGVEEVFDG